MHMYIGLPVAQQFANVDPCSVYLSSLPQPVVRRKDVCTSCDGHVTGKYSCIVTRMCTVRLEQITCILCIIIMIARGAFDSTSNASMDITATTESLLNSTSCIKSYMYMQETMLYTHVPTKYIYDLYYLCVGMLEFFYKLMFTHVCCSFYGCCCF